MSNVTTDLQGKTIKSFLNAMGLDRVFPKVRVNTNGYPYCTFLKDGVQNSAENIYFSKSLADVLREGDDAFGAIRGKYIYATENGNGETRYKIGNPPGEGSYLNLDAL